MNNKKIIPVLLAGGKGTRLWPLSRESLPKQYISISSNNKDTLLQMTQKRISNLKNICAPILICNEEHRFIVAEQMKEIGIKPNSILLEPFGKNTCPAITIAAFKALEIENDPNLLIMSSDHDIQDIDKFIKTIEKGLELCDQNKIVTFGIIPSRPETGYGYIQAAKPLNSEIINGEKIIKFHEKPPLLLAEKFIKNKSYTWNSGIFLFNAKIILKEIENLCPEIAKYCNQSLQDNTIDLDFQRLNKKAFNKCPDLSFDKAVMEKTSKGVVLPMDVGWSDVGSWSSVWDLAQKDHAGNVVQGNIISKNNQNCYIRSENKLLVGLGLSKLIIVDTNDAILIANKDYSQKIKNIVQELKDNDIQEAKTHKKVYRPWGSYESISSSDNWQVKLIFVKPREQLSLQKHNHRAEHWVVVKGIAKVQIEKEILTLKENQSTFIPLGSKHRLINPGDKPLFLIEVQSGDYLGEDDIQRFKDDYGRV